MAKYYAEQPNRRIFVGGLAAAVFGQSSMPAEAAVSVKLLTSNSGNKVRLRVKVSGSQNGFDFGSRTYGPINVPRNGQAVKETYNLVAGAYIEIWGKVHLGVLTTDVIGFFQSGVVIFRKTVTKVVSG